MGLLADRPLRVIQPGGLSLPQIADDLLTYQPKWLSSMAHSALTPDGFNNSLRNLISPCDTAPSQDSNNSFYAVSTKHGLAGKNSAVSDADALRYLSRAGLLDGATELTLCVAFVFSSSDTSTQYMNFRIEGQHSLDIISQTSSSVTWGAAWPGSWDSSGQQTLSGLSDGDLVTLVAVIRQNGGRLFHNGILSGTKSGSSFTISTSATATTIADSTRHRLLLSAAFARALPDGIVFRISRNPWQIFKGPLRIIPVQAASATPQYLAPVSDVAAGSWLPSTGSDLYAMLDESTYSDSDYIYTTSATTATIAIASGGDPAVSTGHTLRYRLLSGSGKIAVTLKQSSTTIASWGPHTLTGAAQDFAQTLTAGEADSITDYSALRVEFTSSLT